MKKCLLILAIGLMAVYTGCQPKEQDGGLVEQRQPLTPAHEVDPAPAGETAVVTDDQSESVTENSTEATAPPEDESAASEETHTESPPVAEAPPSEPMTAETPAPADEETVEETKAEEVPSSTNAAESPVKEDTAETATTTSTEADDGLDATDDVELVGPRIYAAYKGLLSSYVDKNGNVDYATLRRKRGDLYGVVRDFENLDPREYLPWNRNEKLAFWINAYNLFTLKVVIDNYPIESTWAKVMLNYPKNSIVHISDPWTKKYFNVMGVEYTLREIERGNLLSRYGDPRVCLALSYASMGGAMLRNEPYDPNRLDEQLDDQVKRFLADKRGFEINTASGTVYLADIFNWYKQDFIGKYGDIRKFRDKPQHIQAYLNFIVKYISAQDMRYLETQSYTVEFRKYDWRLNEQNK